MCQKCSTLARRYERAIRQIKSVVNGKFETPAAKMEALHRLQDERDDAARKWFKHRRSHVKAASVPEPVQDHPTPEQTKDLLVEFLNGMLDETKKPPKSSADRPRVN